MKYKLKQLVYVKQTHGNDFFFVLARVTQASRDPNFIYVRTVVGEYCWDQAVSHIATPDYDSKDPLMTRLVPVTLLFTKEEIDLLYG